MLCWLGDPESAIEVLGRNEMRQGNRQLMQFLAMLSMSRSSGSRILLRLKLRGQNESSCAGSGSERR